jgi:hypothetical protein
MVAALREKLAVTEFAVLPESPWLEAWGSALIARDERCYKSPNISIRASLGHLPPLHRYADRAPPAPWMTSPAWNLPPLKTD